MLTRLRRLLVELIVDDMVDGFSRCLGYLRHNLRRNLPAPLHCYIFLEGRGDKLVKIWVAFWPLYRNEKCIEQKYLFPSLSEP
jgi:hypothetical protein